MGLTQKLHQLAEDACMLANIPGPTEQQRNISKSVDFIDLAFIALRSVLIGQAETEQTIETTLKSFITSFIFRRTQ